MRGGEGRGGEEGGALATFLHFVDLEWQSVNILVLVKYQRVSWKRDIYTNYRKYEVVN